MHLGSRLMDKMNFNEFQTYINCHKNFNACAANGDQPAVHKESQPVPGLKLKATS